jgi:hypothetical protein
MTGTMPLDPTLDLQGPLESADFPEALTARVVTPGASPRLHGFDVEADLSRHYGPTDLLFLSLTGELPSPEAAGALRVALAFLSPVSVAHASVHAAVLARLCGTTSSSTIGVAAIGLAEQARVLLDAHAELLLWLHEPSGEFPARFRSDDPGDRASVERLRVALASTGFLDSTLDLRPSRDAALLSVLFMCGLRRREQLEAAIVTSRLPSTIAEALSEKVVDFAHYPINLPRYRYEETP